MQDATQSDKRTLILNSLIGSIVGGLIAVQVYLLLGARSPETASTTYHWIALSATAVLTVGAVTMYRIVKDLRTVSILIMLNLVWGLGYGMLIPRLVTF